MSDDPTADDPTAGDPTAGDPADTPDSAAAGAGQNPAEGPAMTINAQYIKDLSFENPHGPENLTLIQDSPEISIEITTSTQTLADNLYEVTLFMRGQAKAKEQTIFIVELTYGGVVTIGEVVPQEMVQPLLLIEAPRHLFPFARNIIASATRDGGFPPLMLNPIDFAALYQEQHGGAIEDEDDAGISAPTEDS